MRHPLDVNLMVVGASNAGKTGTALTISEMIPDEFPKQKEFVTLEDVLYLRIEHRGLSPLLGIKLKIPEDNIRDVSQIKTVGYKDGTGSIVEFQNALQDAFDWVHDRCAKDPSLKLVIDSVSAIDTRVAPAMKNKYREKKFGAFDTILSFYGALCGDLTVLPCQYVLTMHTKKISVYDDAGAKARDEKGVIERGESVPSDFAITGNAREYFYQLMDEIWPVENVAERVKGKVVRERRLRPLGNNLQPHKTGLEEYLHDKEDPNLRKLLNRIKKESGV